jgi:hypothetical protein
MPPGIYLVEQVDKDTAEVDQLLERHGFIGRDGPVLGLERALRRRQAAILIEGLGGIGKSTLAAGFLRWLQRTGGLEHPPAWLSFNEIRSAEYVVNTIGSRIFGTQILSLPVADKLEAVAKALREIPLVVVWDNFESACGIAGTAVTANLSDADQSLLRNLLLRLRGGRTRVLITSRSPEQWLEPRICLRLRLAGLHGEERWQYAAEVLADLGLEVNRDDHDLARLLDQLGGHAMSMQVVLPLQVSGERVFSCLTMIQAANPKLLTHHICMSLGQLYPLAPGYNGPTAPETFVAEVAPVFEAVRKRSGRLLPRLAGSRCLCLPATLRGQAGTGGRQPRSDHRVPDAAGRGIGSRGPVGARADHG